MNRLLAIALVLLLGPSLAQATTYYVDENHVSCSDAGAGTSESAPWCRLHRATDGVVTSEGGSGGPYTPVVAGDVVYVKNGTYHDTTTAVQGEVTPKFNPTNSGTSGSLITFRAYPGHTSVIVSRNLVTPEPTPKGNNPVIGCSNRNYVVWDGFVTAAFTDARLVDSTGCAIKRSYIDKGMEPNSNSTGNYTGIWIERTVNAAVDNNRLLNIYDTTGSGSEQAVGIVSYDNQGLRVNNNDCGPNVTECYHDKRNGVTNTWEFNYCHQALIYCYDITSFVAGACGTCPVTNVVMRYSICDRPGRACWRVQGSSVTSGLEIHNISARGVGSATSPPAMRLGGFMNPNPSGATPTAKVHSNVIVRDSDANTGNHGFYMYEGTVGPPADLLTDFSVLYGINSSGTLVADTGTNAFLPAAGGSYETLAQWQSSGRPLHANALDVNSISANPQWVGPFPASGPAAFKLDATSPARNFGRVGGVSGGAAVHAGAYYNDSACIGPESACPSSVPGVPGALRGRWRLP